MPTETKNGMITNYEYSHPAPKGRGLGLGVYLPLIVIFWIVVFVILELAGVL